MPLPSTGYYEVQARSVGVPVIVSTPQIRIPPNRDIRAHAMVVQANSAGNSPEWAVSAYISRYVQDDSTHEGVFRELSGHNITEIVLTGNVLNASAVGSLLVEYY